VNSAFNQPHRSRYADLDGRRPENVPFPEWAEDQSRRSNEGNAYWIGGVQVVDGFERLLSAEARRLERRRTAQAEGWRAGEPGE